MGLIEPTTAPFRCQAMPVLDNIPYHDFGGSGSLMHFSHANGYPPLAYGPLLDKLANHQRVIAMYQRPLWPGSDPMDIQDWQPFADDLEIFIKSFTSDTLVGLGHSVGAINTLRVALRHPHLFHALILVDPVLFPPLTIYFMNLFHRSGISYKIDPLVRSALRRRRIFQSKKAMFENYRRKPVFARINDPGLQAYVDSIARQRPDGQVELNFPAEWEARIHSTTALIDMQIWRTLHTLQLPTMILYGEQSNTFWHSTALRAKRLLPNAHIISIPDSGHLVPLERPEYIYSLIQSYLPVLQPAQV